MVYPGRNVVVSLFNSAGHEIDHAQKKKHLRDRRDEPACGRVFGVATKVPEDHECSAHRQANDSDVSQEVSRERSQV